ncbi:MAG: hypothetical protein BGO30_10320 [Bacteroidetes bacterium 41-46]|nr:MAG: hypothetical protein BGO30_10320 [Bacteroidetes bacterium 41-46]
MKKAAVVIISLIAVVIVTFLLTPTTFYQLLKISPSSKLLDISYSNDAPDTLYQFLYADTTGNEYLKELRTSHNLEQLIAGQTDELDKIKTILDWTSKQWSHDGSNTPSNHDAITILAEARQGKQFRCVEYGIVATAALNSIGIPARTLGLKTRDVEKVMRGAGHVVTEVYSNQYEKWIYIDPQFNIMPTLNETPINGVELQKAIYTKDPGLKLINKEGELDKEDSENYIKWIGKYLFYFDVLFDQKTMNSEEFMRINGMSKLTLVPAGHKEPQIFQRSSKINYSYYTNSLNDFYRKPH